MKNFIASVIISTLVILGIHSLLVIQGVVPFLWQTGSLYAYFLLITLGANLWLFKKLKSRPQSFVTSFLGAMSVKLFSSLLLLLALIYIYPAHKLQLAGVFAILYFVLTIISTSFLFRKLRISDLS
jgi:hypothetical protein